MAYESTNPYHGKTVKTFDELTATQLETWMATAAKTYDASTPGTPSQELSARA